MKMTRLLEIANTEQKLYPNYPPAVRLTNNQSTREGLNQSVLCQ
ncbi:hypothetical protein ACN23B_13200 [Anabaena sp. FACHB-709]|nr:hypothetical protein [Anabaena cylindrica]